MNVLPQQTGALTSADGNTPQARVFSKVFIQLLKVKTLHVCVCVHPRRDKISVLRSGGLSSAAASDIQTHFKESCGGSFQGLCGGGEGGIQKSTYQLSYRYLPLRPDKQHIAQLE